MLNSKARQLAQVSPEMASPRSAVDPSAFLRVVLATIAGGEGWSRDFEGAQGWWGCPRALLHSPPPFPNEEVGGGPSDFPAFVPSAFVAVIFDFPSSAPWRDGAQLHSLLDRTGSFRLLSVEVIEKSLERRRDVARAALISDCIEAAALSIQNGAERRQINS